MSKANTKMVHAIIIEKGVPLPNPKPYRGSRIEQARSMQIGDSALFDTQQQAYSFAKRLSALGFRTACRPDEKEKGKWRCWRIK